MKSAMEVGMQNKAAQLKTKQSFFRKSGSADIKTS
jgi:hypothetical protein